MKPMTRQILYIEDDPETARLIAADLAKRAFKVLIAHGGEEGFRAILRSAPDLVLCDRKMPGMSGQEVLRRLTEVAPRFHGMPFIFLTALGDRADERAGPPFGADDCLTKPVDMDMLAAIIKGRLARMGSWSPSQNKVDLNEREIDVLTWSARGKTSAETAQILSLSKRSVDYNISSARRKLGVASRIEAAVKASMRKLIKP
jgi:DNA-binding response OmpR family regulator